jgi:hypothetical protein
VESVAAVIDALAGDIEARGESPDVVIAFEHDDAPSHRRESIRRAESRGTTTEHGDVEGLGAHSAALSIGGAADSVVTRSGYP